MTNLAGLPPLGQKQARIISPAIRKSARGQQCTMRSDWCCHDPATVVLCHMPVRRFSLGGLGMKVPDIFAYYGCHTCHAHEADMGWDDLLRAMVETQMRMIEAGLIEVSQ